MLILSLMSLFIKLYHMEIISEDVETCISIKMQMTRQIISQGMAFCIGVTKMSI